MAIASVTQFTNNLGIPEIFQQVLTQVPYRNKFLSYFPTEVYGIPGDKYLWKVNLAANTSAEVFTEGAAQPTPVSQTYANAELSFIYARAMTRITGHLRDAMKNMGDRAAFDVIDKEFTLGAEDVNDILATSFLGASNNGIQLAVDSAGTYANVNRSTYSQWGSYENALGGALTFAALSALREAIRDNDRGGVMDLILCPWNQVSNIQELVGAPGAANNSFRYDATSADGKLQLAAKYASTYFGEATVVGVGDLTDTVVIGMDSRDVKFVERRPLEIQEDISGDDRVYQISRAMTLVVPNPHLAGKQTGVTA